MATLTINGRKVTVDDSFLSLSPEDQEATVDEIAGSLGAEQAASPLASDMSAATRRFDADPADVQASVTRDQYDRLPEWQKAIVAATDLGDVASQAFGFRDKAVAAARAPFTGNSYDEELEGQRQQSQAARDRSGLAQYAADLYAPAKLAGKGLTLTGRFGSAAAEGVKGLLARTGLMAAEGAGYGALTAAGNDQDIGSGAVSGLVGGAGGNLVGEGVMKGVRSIAGKFNPKQQTPTVDELRARGRAAYKRAESEGVGYNAAGVGDLRQKITDDLTARAFDPANEPGVMPVLNRLEKMENVSFEGLDSLRKVAGNGYRPGMKSNNDALRGVIGRIDEMVDAPNPAFIQTGKDPAAAAAAVREARSEWHKARKLDTVERLIDKGELIGGSQINQDIAGATQRQLRTILTNEAKQRGFNQAELKQVRKAVLGTPGRRALHAVSGLLPQGKLGAMIHGATALSAGVATGGTSIPLQIGGMVAGYGAKRAIDHLSNKSVAELTRLIASGGVPTEIMENVVQRLAKSKREALSRALTVFGTTYARNSQPANQ